MKYIILTVFSIVLCVCTTIAYNLYLKRKYDNLHDKLQNNYRTSLDKLIRDISKLNSEREQIEKMRNSDIKYFLHKSLLYDHLKDTLVFRHIDTHDYLEYNRFYNYLHDEYKNVKHNIENITVEAKIKGSDDEPYKTTLEECSCPDFKRMPYPKEPCKHMYMLAYELALLNELPLEAIKKELALATHKYLKAKQQAKNTTVNSHEYCERKTIEYTIEKLINEDDLMKIVKSYNGDIRIRALAEHFNVTEDFMRKAVEYYFER